MSWRGGRDCHLEMGDGFKVVEDGTANKSSNKRVSSVAMGDGGLPDEGLAIGASGLWFAPHPSRVPAIDNALMGIVILAKGAVLSLSHPW